MQLHATDVNLLPDRRTTCLEYHFQPFFAGLIALSELEVKHFFKETL
jgi:hypothetical protein